MSSGSRVRARSRRVDEVGEQDRRLCSSPSLLRRQGSATLQEWPNRSIHDAVTPGGPLCLEGGDGPVDQVEVPSRLLRRRVPAVVHRGDVTHRLAEGGRRPEARKAGIPVSACPRMRV